LRHNLSVTPRRYKGMTKLNYMAWIVQCAFLIYMGAVAASAPNPKLLACLNSCDEALMACVQPELQKPVIERTIKEFNRVRACTVTEGRCDRRCRRK
jgi:hypothetical protein